MAMKFTVEIEQEEDGRWIAEVIDLPGVLAYGNTPEQAKAKVQALALVSSRTVLSMAKPGPILLPFPLQPHESVAKRTCQTCPGSAFSHGLVH